MKQKLLSIFTLVAFSLAGQSIERSVASVSGNTISNSSVTMGFTVGQTIIATVKNNNSEISQGFQQGRLNVPTIELSASSDGITVTTTIGYRSTATIGLDPGFDIGNFAGASFDVFTHLVDGSSTSDFTYQSLPDSNYDSMIVPLGLVATSGKEVVFAASNSNLPTNLQVVLEDRELNEFVVLGDTSTYTVELTSSEDGIGRFYLHTRFEAIWDGTTSSAWKTATNWSNDINPLETSNVIIPDVTNTPVIEGNVIAQMNDLTVEASSSFEVATDGAAIIDGNFDSSGTITIISDENNSGAFIVKGTANGEITYERGGLLANKWSIISAPVTGQSIKEFVENPANNIRVNPTVTPNRYAVAYYDDSKAEGSKWVYYTTDDLIDNSITFEKGRSYIVSRATDGTVTFTGTLETGSVTKAVTASEWNSVGNPYPAFLPINGNANANFIMDNITKFDPEYVSAYVWDNSQNKYIAKSLIDTDASIAPGQGIFVRTTSGVSDITFNEAQRSTQPVSGGVFSRTANEIPSIKLTATSEGIAVTTDISYRENVTLGLDPGYDIGNFDADNFDVFTRLLDGSSDKNYTYQSLPNSDYDNMIIPIGIKGVAGVEVAFSITSLNLPEGMQVYIEDKEHNVFQTISETNSYKVQLSEAINGVGRFYLHTQSKTLSTDIFDTKEINIYNVNSVLIVEGITDNFDMELFNTNGSRIFSESIQGEGRNSITLPSLETGVYIARVTTVSGTKDKKIIIKK